MQDRQQVWRHCVASLKAEIRIYTEDTEINPKSVLSIMAGRRVRRNADQINR